MLSMIQLGDWKGAANRGLWLVDTHPDNVKNVKLLYRLALANLGIHLHDKALGFIKRALRLEPNNLASIKLKGEIMEAR